MLISNHTAAQVAPTQKEPRLVRETDANSVMWKEGQGPEEQSVPLTRKT